MKILATLFLACSMFEATIQESKFNKGLDSWNSRQTHFLNKTYKIKHCFTEAKSNELMQIINSHQSSSVGLPLEDAIRIEYDNWLTEDWFPNNEELAAMKLDEIM